MIDPAQTIIEINRHLAVLNDDSVKMAASLAMLTERVDWICWFMKLTVGAVVSTLAVNIWQLIRWRSNSKNNF